MALSPDQLRELAQKVRNLNERAKAIGLQREFGAALMVAWAVGVPREIAIADIEQMIEEFEKKVEHARLS